MNHESSFLGPEFLSEPIVEVVKKHLKALDEMRRYAFARGVHAGRVMAENLLNNEVPVRTGLGDASTTYIFSSLSGLQRNPRMKSVEGFFSTRAALLAIRTAEETLLTVEELSYASNPNRRRIQRVETPRRAHPAAYCRNDKASGGRLRE